MGGRRRGQGRQQDLPGGAIPDDEVFEAVDASYDAVVAKLPRKDRPAAS